jgi:hypothetical protein
VFLLHLPKFYSKNQRFQGGRDGQSGERVGRIEAAGIERRINHEGTKHTKGFTKKERDLGNTSKYLEN